MHRGPHTSRDIPQFVCDFDWVRKHSTDLAPSPQAFKRELLLSGLALGYLLLAAGCRIAKPSVPARSRFSTLLRANSHIKVALAVLISPAFAALLYKTTYNLEKEPINEETESALMSLTYQIAVRALDQEKVNFLPLPMKTEINPPPSGQFKYERKMASLALLMPSGPGPRTEKDLKKTLQPFAEAISLSHDYPDGKTRNIKLAAFDLYLAGGTNANDRGVLMKVVPTRIRIRAEPTVAGKLGDHEAAKVLKDLTPTK